MLSLSGDNRFICTHAREGEEWGSRSEQEEAQKNGRTHTHTSAHNEEVAGIRTHSHFHTNRMSSSCPFPTLRDSVSGFGSVYHFIQWLEQAPPTYLHLLCLTFEIHYSEFGDANANLMLIHFSSRCRRSCPAAVTHMWTRL